MKTATRFAPRLAPGLAVATLAALLPLAASQAGAEASPQPAPQPSAEAAKDKPRLPVIAAKGPTTRIKGKIVRSSRGRKGPVRLLIERENGPKVTALVAPDDYCDEKGLSLRNGESVELEGTMLKSERPMLVATAVIVDGKAVQLRDAEGKLIGAGKPGAPAGAETKASLSGPKPTPAPSK
ncbi:MAG: hypothetical protein AB1689_24540 [Thermodesulfobacteriota bacterium]